MNIFILDHDPCARAKAHHNKHVVKMILESAQLLASALHSTGEANDSVYKQTHINHPCSIWVRSSLSNYTWLLEHIKALNEEYCVRFNKPVAYVHKSAKLALDVWPRPRLLPDIGLTPFVLCMPDEYKCDDPVTAYRNYYKAAKISNDTRWGQFGPPSWVA